MSDHPTVEGVVFPNDRKAKETHPDWRGHLDMSQEIIARVVEMAQAGVKPELKLAMWSRKSKQGGNPYFYVSAEAYLPDAVPGAVQPQAAAAPPVQTVVAQPVTQPGLQPAVGWGPQPVASAVGEQDVPF